jgi:hypothetical protein
VTIGRLRDWRPWHRHRTVWTASSSEDFEDHRDRPRTFSEAHRRLLVQMRAVPQEVWADRALLACLEHLAVSTTTEAREVVVERAWVDGPDAFVVIYQPPYDRGRLVGLRRNRSDADAPESEWKLGDMSPTPYISDPAAPDPVAFGKTVADFDIGEPMGNGVNILRADDDGVEWWGNLGEHLPTPR